MDLDARRLTVNQARTVAHHKVVISEPKTKAGRRPNALDPETLAALKTHRARQSAERLAAGPAWEDSGLVFTWEDGRPIHPRQLGRWLDSLIKAAGLPRITPHGLRHSYITMLLRKGVAVHKVSRRVGHSRASVTFDVYGHLLPGDDEDMALAGAAALDAAGGSR